MILEPRRRVDQALYVVQQVQAFLARQLESRGYADVYFDAAYFNGRQGKAQQLTSRAAVVAMDVNGNR